MKRIVLIILIFVAITSTVLASNIEGTKTYKDYLFILVHGMNGGSHHFNGQDDRDKGLQLLEYLENNLGLEGHVYAYSFKNKNGSAIDNAREFGDRSYNNTATYINEEGKKNVPMDGKCWLEKARDDYIKWFVSGENNKDNPTHRPPREDEIPSKYIVLSHSFGNMAVRLYIYSKELKVFKASYMPEEIRKNGFYRDDIEKVVFVAPPFTGSDLAYPAMIPKVAFQGYLVWDKFINEDGAWRKMAHDIWMNYTNFLKDPYAPYKTAKEASFVLIDYPLFIDNFYGFWGYSSATNTSVKPMDLIEGGGYGALDAGTWQLMPEVWNYSFGDLLTVGLDDPTEEPAYSVIYGLGGPVLNISDSLKNKILKTAVANVSKSIAANKEGIDEYVKKLSTGASDTVDFNINNDTGTARFFNELGSEIELLMPGSGFYDLSTGQAKFVSIVMSNSYLNLTEDGDSAVPVHSAKGIFEDKLGRGGTPTKHLQNAKFYSKVFKGKFNSFLENEFPNYVEGAAIAYAGLRIWGMPHETALPICQWPLALLIVGKVAENKEDIWQNHFIHTNTMLKEYDLIRTAILDTPAILTINDLQALVSTESDSSTEATAMCFSVGATVPSGYESVKVRSVTENRKAQGSVSLPVPMTLKALTATGEGDRKYVTSMTVTKPPSRIAGKLNYLVPALMKQFEYSFNFAAWKPIQNVNPETGEFILENLPFAEGQNVIAVRSTNAVDVQSHQLLKIILNTIKEQYLALKMMFAPVQFA